MNLDRDVDLFPVLEHFRQTRRLSIELCRPLQPEDYRIQSMPDVSPPWWNLGHTTWFFAKNVLEPNGLYTGEDERLEYPLNSYYESLGARLPRAQRGLVTRPTTEEILNFRASVDERLEALLETPNGADRGDLAFLVTTGVHHEQQHQELLVTELKHILGSNPRAMRDSYSPREASPRAAAGAMVPVAFEGGLHSFGNLEGGWCWDNEMPIHRAYLEPFALGSRLATNRDYLEFMADGGYRRPLLWLSNGWAKVNELGWTAPMYWEDDGGTHKLWTLSGLADLDPEEPVCHVGFYEADAFARWKSETDPDWRGARLPTEREWEHAARASGFPGGGGNFLDRKAFHPRPPAAEADGPLRQIGGDVWEWTTNHYEPYPGYRPFEGNLMEYNGKFMDNQRVLRGGSCATPENHIRASYRNFWPADTRFQFTGIRLARGI
jgi:ergothioneine biosynthesis protein EgtB